MIRALSFISFIFLTASLLSGCTLGPGSSQLPLNPTAKVPTDSNKPSAGASPGDTIVGFDEVYSKVFQQSCDHCHQKDDKPLMNNYADYAANANDIRRQVVDLRKMPKKKPLSAEQIALVKIWLDQGAQEFSKKPETNPTPSPTPETSPSPSPSPSPTPVSIPTTPPPPTAGNPPPSNNEGTRPVAWETVKAAFFEKKCTSCHFSGNTDGLSSYDDVATVKATIGTIFYTVVISPVMPPPPKNWDENTANPNQLSREQKDLLSEWIVDGMK